jgi:hypothetical protein
VKATVLLLLCLLVLGSAALLRFVDADEGFYLMAAKLVGGGEMPYRDFFYPQAPILPYLYAPLRILPLDPWWTSRLFTAGIASAAVLLIVLSIPREDRSARVFAALLCLLSGWFVEWLVVVKTYGLAVLLASLAFFALTRPGNRRRPWLLPACALAACIASRLTMAPLLPAFLLAALLVPRAERRFSPRDLALFGAVTVLLTAAFFVPFLLAAPDATFFCNLGYHAGRSGGGLVGDMFQKRSVLMGLLGMRGAEQDLAVQLILLGLGTLGAWFLACRPPSVVWAACAGAALGLAHFLPTPTHTQYFVVCIPFLIHASALLLARGWRTKRLRPLALAALAAYAAAWPFTILRTGFSAAGLQEIPADAAALKIPNIRAVSSKLSDYATQHSLPIVASWSGYLVSSDADFVRGCENHFAQEIGKALSPELRRRYHTPTTADLFDGLGERGSDCLYVRGIWFYRSEWDPVEGRGSALFRTNNTVIGIWRHPKTPAP